MREDMYKVIVERPRRGFRSASSRDGRLYRASEDVSPKMGMKHGIQPSKWLLRFAIASTFIAIKWRRHATGILRAKPMSSRTAASAMCASIPVAANSRSTTIGSGPGANNRTVAIVWALRSSRSALTW